MARRNPKLVDRSDLETLPQRGLVGSIIHWRDPKLSGIVFGSGLTILLLLAYCSVISVVSNVSLGVLACSIVVRICKDILRLIDKDPGTQLDSLAFLNYDIQLFQEKTHEILDIVIVHVNAFLGELKRLFLVEDFIQSAKFAFMLWVLTYVGSWFNGLTVIIIVFVSMFTLPKIYENHKSLIDEYLALIGGKIQEVINRIREAIPASLRRKTSDKKEE